MATAGPLPIYDELLDVLVGNADTDQLEAFRLPSDKQFRLDELLQRNREDRLTDAERDELQEFERLEHLGRMLKARARQKQLP
jgi:regulator of sigma D